MDDENLEEVIEIFRNAGGTLRMSEAMDEDIHRRELYTLREKGSLEEIERGLFRLSELPEPAFPEFLTIAKKAPNGVICLISALAFHEVTTQIPHFVYLAIPRNASKPALTSVNLRTFWLSEKMLTTGVEKHPIDGTTFKIFNLEKTLVDCVKYRNKIGIDVAIEALKIAWTDRRINLKKMMQYAKIFRSEKPLKLIMETITNG